MKKSLPWLVALVLAFAGLFRGYESPRAAHGQSAGGYHPVVNSWNVGSVTSGNAILASNFVGSQPASVFRITVVLGSSAPLAVYTTDGTHTFTSWLNGATALSAGCVYTFTTGARSASAPGGVAGGPTGFNFKVGSATTVPYLWVDEVTTGSD